MGTSLWSNDCITIVLLPACLLLSSMASGVLAYNNLTSYKMEHELWKGRLEVLVYESHRKLYIAVMSLA